MNKVNERRLLQFIYEDSLSAPQPFMYSMPHGSAAAASDMTIEEVEECLRRFVARGWVKRKASLGGYGLESFFAAITPDGAREVEERPFQIAVNGTVSVSIDAVAGLGLDKDDARRLKELMDFASQPGDTESRLESLREAMNLAANGMTIGQGLAPFLYSLGLLAQSIA